MGGALIQPVDEVPDSIPDLEASLLLTGSAGVSIV